MDRYVSRLATVEKTHPHTHAITLDHLFMYKARQADARAARRAASLRSASGGALKPKAKALAAEGKVLSGSANGSKAQLLLLCKQVEERAGSYSTKALHKRKAAGLCTANLSGRFYRPENP